MPTGAITQNIDTAQVVLYVFWLFFFLLILYIRREDRREGYPLQSDRQRRDSGSADLGIPKPKTFLLSDGRTVQAPRANGDTRIPSGYTLSPVAGSPLIPDGDPMTAGIGAGSWAERDDVVDVTMEGIPRIVPLRVDHEFSLDTRDPDPRGMAVIGADGQSAGTVTDVWVDRAEMMIRYLEVELAGATDHRHVLLPMNMSRVRGKSRQVSVVAITAEQFLDVPGTASREQVTRLEEDCILGYYGGGYSYATVDRAESLM